MLRRFYLTTALEQLLAQGKIRRPSRAHTIVRMVINDGAAALSEADRRVYDIEIIPMIEAAASY